MVVVIGVGIALSQKAKAEVPPVEMPPGVIAETPSQNGVVIEFLSQEEISDQEVTVLARLINRENFPIVFTNIFEVLGPSGLITQSDEKEITLGIGENIDILYRVNLIEGNVVGTVYNWQIKNQVSTQDQTPVSDPKSGSINF